VSRALEVTVDRKVTQLGEPMPYLAHFLFIKENIGKQTLQSCWSSLLFLLSLSLSPLPLHSIPPFIVPRE
jgi:hypothetical protein